MLSQSSDPLSNLLSSDANPSTATEPMVIGAVTNSINPRQHETYHRMIERVKDYHSKLGASKHRDKGKVDFYVCSICFVIFPEQDALRNHFIQVCLYKYIYKYMCVRSIEFNFLFVSLLESRLYAGKTCESKHNINI